MDAHEVRTRAGERSSRRSCLAAKRSVMGCPYHPGRAQARDNSGREWPPRRRRRRGAERDQRRDEGGEAEPRPRMMPVRVQIRAAAKTLHEGHCPRVRRALTHHPGLLLQPAEYRPREVCAHRPKDLRTQRDRRA